MQLDGSVVQRLSVVFEQATVLMSLLQPPPETYDLFDDIMLLSDGAPSSTCRHHLSRQLMHMSSACQHGSALPT